MGCFVKRLFDLLVALIGTALAAPAWLVISLAIMLEDGSPVLFWQTREGKGGKPFQLCKFRTMTVQETAELREDRQDYWRVTRVGRILRRLGLDSLPELLNIIKGDMSLVGPRVMPSKVLGPDTTYYSDISQVPNYDIRSGVRPGLTGLAQVCLPKHTSYRDKYRFDSLYVRRMCLWLDIQILAMSVWRTAGAGWDD